MLFYAGLHKFSKVDEGFWSSFLASFWMGYEREYPVPENEIDNIPWLLLNRSLIVYGYMLKIWPDERDGLQDFYVNRIERSILNVRKELGL